MSRLGRGEGAAVLVVSSGSESMEGGSLRSDEAGEGASDMVMCMCCVESSCGERGKVWRRCSPTSTSANAAQTPVYTLTAASISLSSPTRLLAISSRAHHEHSITTGKSTHAHA